MNMPKQDVIELNHEFALYVPSQCICKELLDDQLRTEILNEVQSKFSNWFGGFQDHKIDGGWVLPDGTIAKEVINVICSYSGEDAFDDHIDDAKKLAVSVADRLTQDRVLLTIDGKRFLFPRTNPDDALCSHNKKLKIVEIEPTPLSAHKYQSLHTALSLFGSLTDARNLFCGILNYKVANGHIPCANWPDSIKNLMVAVPQIIADTNGFKIVFIRLHRDKISRSAKRTIIKRIYKDNPLFTGIFIVTNEQQNEWVFANAKLTGGKDNNLLIRRMRVGKGERVRTATERMALVEISEHEEGLPADEIQQKHDRAFDVEAVTKEFFARYCKTFDELKTDIFKQIKDKSFAHDYSLQFLNRCMFIYFIYVNCNFILRCDRPPLFKRKQSHRRYQQ
jgi:hypothetical protein